MTAGPIAVTGATGNIGGAVVQALLAAGEPEVLAVVRNPAKMRGPATPTARIADYTDRTALTAAFNDVRTLVFIPSDGEAAPMLVHHLNVLDAAVAAGVERVVLLGMMDIDADSPFCFSSVYRETERVLRDSGLAHTILRTPIYAEFFARWVAEAAETGKLSLPIGSGRMSFISRTDVAHCLVETLRREDTEPRVVTGDRTFDLPELADLTSRLAGRPVRAVNADPTDYCVRLLREGTDPWWVYGFSSMFASIAQGRFDAVTDTCASLLGRSPVPFEDIARRTLAGH